jgi:hypothetical protein
MDVVNVLTTPFNYFEKDLKTKQKKISLEYYPKYLILSPPIMIFYNKVVQIIIFLSKHQNECFTNTILLQKINNN